eukprot:4836789-Alexandrium_andersonii.AAC.1
MTSTTWACATLCSTGARGLPHGHARHGAARGARQVPHRHIRQCAAPGAKQHYSARLQRTHHQP